MLFPKEPVFIVIRKPALWLDPI